MYYIYLYLGIYVRMIIAIRWDYKGLLSWNNTATVVLWMQCWCFFGRFHFDWTRFKNSSRVFESSLNTPSMVDVTVLLFIFCTPLMTMHMWLIKDIERKNNYHAILYPGTCSIMMSLAIGNVYIIIIINTNHYKIHYNGLASSIIYAV